ncbi:MAG: hypothetical protein FD174_627 [Geobacteraceae bacterium]|nr:MAG: hypothetical protein FD174_627 [Geobacteraceae bacterium]
MTTSLNIRVGTCSWSEKSLIQSGEFYPKGVSSAEERLRFYASYFDTVEVDSTYYAIPAAHTTELWAERTPSYFLFHIKVYGALTGHGIDPRTLPKPIRELLPAADKEQRTIYIKEPELLKTVADAFVASLAPLRSTDKLGLLVFQYPPWFWYKSADLDYILTCKELMGDLPIAVEFRHGSWLTDHHRDKVFKFLRDNGITYIPADEPQYGTLASIPFLPEVTTDIAYLRLHGRNKETWLKKGVETSVRYDYLYRSEELKDFTTAAKELSHKAKMTFIMFNNCHLGYAIKNALEMLRLMH